MVRSNAKFKSVGRRKKTSNNSYEKMMKTLLLQNQQIIIQQQNMMFMVMKQLQPLSTTTSTIQGSLIPTTNTNNNHLHHHQQQQQQQQQQQPLQQHSQNLQHHHHHHHQQQQHQSQQQQHVIHDDTSIQSHHLYSQANSANLDTQQLQQVDAQLQENLCNYLTPAASEQDPIKPEEDDLAAILDGDGLLHNNLLYNPQTDIGSVTPYKSHQSQQQTPSYYSSGCESLTTPRVEQQRQPTTTNISQNVVKNLADSFKSPTKPKINVQILSNSATGSMKNSKAKIIQRMNISEFLRHVHPETDEVQKNSTQ